MSEAISSAPMAVSAVRHRIEAYVRFEDVQMSYDGKTLVVNELNLDIREGEFLTILGPSGSGKTTCLMMLAGFETPTHGKIIVDGVSQNKVPAHKRNIGVVFQNYALFTHMTVAENVAYPLRVRRMSRSEVADRTNRALDMVRLRDLGSRRPAQLSGGQQQRVAVARALAFDPKLVLMDEPLGALDKKLRDQMQYEIKHLHEQLGITFVYVTHDQGEALIMSDRIAVLHEGRLQQVATPTVLYEQAANIFVAQFIGESNCMTGTIVDVNDRICTVEISGGYKVKAVAANVRGTGSKTMLCLRPERVLLDPPNGICPNIFDAQVREIIYIGNFTRVRLSVCGCEEILLTFPNSIDGRQLSRGDIVKVGWRAEDCRALDAP